MASIYEELIKTVNDTIRVWSFCEAFKTEYCETDGRGDGWTDWFREPSKPTPPVRDEKRVLEHT